MFIWHLTEREDLLMAKLANAVEGETVYLLDMTLMLSNLMLINVTDVLFQRLPTLTK